MLSAIFNWENLAIFGTLGVSAAVWWFFPPLRGLAVKVGGVVAGLFFIYSKGKRDERARQKERVRAAIQRGDQARRDAESSVNRGVRDPRDRPDL